MTITSFGRDLYVSLAQHDTHFCDRPQKFVSMLASLINFVYVDHMPYGAASSRKRDGESTHDFQHRLIAERYEMWAKAPKRSGIDKVRRRELGKSAWWTLTGHLRGHHDYRKSFLSQTWDEVTTIHDQLHTESA